MASANTVDGLAALAKKLGLPAGFVQRHGAAAVRLLSSASRDQVGASRLGGLPELPEGVEWPRWDARDFDAKQLAESEQNAKDIGVKFWVERAARLRARSSRCPVPLAFLAQLDLSELSGLPHGLPLPQTGHLWFFYDLAERPWGYCATHRGSFQVLYAEPGPVLKPREPPIDLPKQFVLKSKTLECRPTWTLPNSVDGVEASVQSAHEKLQALMDDSPASVAHQVGGHPDQIQGNMQQACALVSRGVYLGKPPELAADELERLSADAGEWKLLLQLASDEELGWMWGQTGNLYWWMRESDIRRGAWDQAWFQLQFG